MALEATTRFAGDDVAAISTASPTRGSLPHIISVENKSEVTSRAFDH
jgi:hypothetical protein